MYIRLFALIPSATVWLLLGSAGMSLLYLILNDHQLSSELPGAIQLADIGKGSKYHVIVGKSHLIDHVTRDELRVREYGPDANAGVKNKKKKPLLTMFTTFELNPLKTGVYIFTLHNWSLLRPCVHPIVYLTDMSSHWVNISRSFGWEVRKAPRTRHQLPVLKDMYLDATAAHDTPFYVYANGDILFDEGLVETARVFNESGLASSDAFLAVGRRYNVNFTFLTPESVTPKSVTRLRTGRELFWSNTIDYFMTSRQGIGIPWQQVPDFVIGRIRFDNWLVYATIKRGSTVVDTSETITAVHQTDHEGNQAGHLHVNDSWNVPLVSDVEKYMQSGRTCCAPYRTTFTQSEETHPVMVRRTQKQAVAEESLCRIYPDRLFRSIRK